MALISKKETNELSMRDSMSVKLAKPRGGLVVDLPSKCWGSEFIMEIKWDGVRESCEIGKSGNTLQGRSRHGKTKGSEYSKAYGFVDRSDCVPHIRDLVFPKRYRKSLLDGEVVWGDDSALALSNPARGNQVYNVFDCLFFGGDDVRAYPFMERRKMLKEVVRSVNCPLLRVGRILKASRSNFDLAMKRGHEGAVFKSKEGAYGTATHAEGWWRAKGVDTHDVVILDVSQASRGGSTSRGVKAVPVESVATIAVGMFDPEGKLVEVGRARFNLRISHWAETMWARWPHDRGRVIEIRASGFNRKRFRWCEMMRFRDDKQATHEDCPIPEAASLVMSA